MANTIFSEGEIIEGTYEGHPFRYRALRDGDQGSGSVYGPAMDEIGGKKVFLKKYIDPAPRCEWFSEFIDYQHRIYEQINASVEAQKMIAGASFFQEARGRFWQAIEYIDNSKDLRSYLESPDTTWDQRKTFASVFMYAMKILHKEVRLVHGDLKPENLLLTPVGDGKNYKIKLIDFDRPILLDAETIPWEGDGYLGSPGYYSPEHKRGTRPIEKSDVFTCGLILYELLAKGGHPYDREDIDVETYASSPAPVPELYGSFGSRDKDRQVVEMLQKMLNPDPDERPTAEEVHACLISRVKGPRTPLPPPNHIPPAPKPAGGGTTTQKGAADIVFLLDATGSMGPCINALKAALHSFIHSMLVGDEAAGIMPVKDWRARVVGYRDFLDANSSKNTAYRYKRYGKGGWFVSNPFTRNEEELYKQLDSLKAFGGGDNPDESLLDALMLVMKAGTLPPNASDFTDEKQGCAWRLNRVGKVIVVFTDAGFQELSFSGDISRFEGEKEKYPFDFRGCDLDDIENGIEASHCKIFIYAPQKEQYQDLSELNAVTIWTYDGWDDGLESVVHDKSKFDKLLQSIVKGVSVSASAELNITLPSRQ